MFLLIIRTTDNLVAVIRRRTVLPRSLLQAVEVVALSVVGWQALVTDASVIMVAAY